MEKLSIELSIDDPNQICRICLSTESTQLWNLFGNSIVDGYIISIPDIIEYTLDIQVNASDGGGEQLPKKICDQCKTQVIQYYSFKSKSDRINQILNNDTIKSNHASSFESSSSLPNDTCNEPIDDNLLKPLKTEHKEEYLSVTVINGNAVIKKTKFNNNISFENNSNSTTVNKSDIISNVKQQETIMEYSNEFNDDEKNENETENGEDADEDDNDDNNNDGDVDYIDYDSDVDDKNEYSDNETDNEIDNGINEKYNIDDVQQQISIKVKEKNQSIQLNGKQNIFYCKICKLNLHNRKQFYNHCITEEHSLFCRKCCKLFKSKGFYYRHQKVHINDDKGDDNNNKVKQLTFNCDACDEKCNNKVAYNQHIHLHKTIKLFADQCELFPCSECLVVYLTNDQLIAHTENKHSNELQYIDYQFLMDGTDAYRCGICDGKLFTSYNELQLHIITHLTSFKCPITDCGRTYENIKHLNLHIMLKHSIEHSQNTQLTCRFCNLSIFPTSIALQDHMNRDCVEKKFNCSHCDKKFFSQKALSHHFNFVIKEKKHMCQLCGKMFTQPVELRIHTRSHTGERPYKCTKCDKSYKTLSTFSLHTETHNDKNSFECNVCKRILHTRQSYRNHLKRHTQEKTKICETCGKKFFTRYHLQLHVQKIHEKIKHTTNIDDNIRVMS